MFRGFRGIAPDKLPCGITKAMLAGILQIRSPSGSNGWHIPKINPDIKKQPALLQAVKGIVGSDYYTLNYYNLKYNLSFLYFAFTVGDGNA